MKRALVAALALLGASLFPLTASAQTVDPNSGIVSFDTNHSGRSQSFRLDAGDYTYDWSAMTTFDGPNEIGCTIVIQGTTDAGYTGRQLLVNEIIHYSGGSYVPLTGMPGGRYSLNVFGCGELTSTIGPAI